MSVEAPPPHREQIELRPPFDAGRLLGFLAARAVPGVELVTGSSYARTMRLPHGTGLVRLDFPTAGTPPVVGLEVTTVDPRDNTPAIAACRRLLDADCDPAAVQRTLAADPALRPALAGTPGIRVPGAVNGPEIVIRAILGQQISVAAARTAAGRLAALAAERPQLTAPGLTLLFPSPGALAALGSAAVAGPRRRAETLVRTAAAMANGELVVEFGRGTDELSAELTALPGIGPWTAGYVAMRVLGDHDVLLTTDLVLRLGATALGLPDTPKDLAQHGSRWAPHRSYAGMLLWAHSRTAASASS